MQLIYRMCCIRRYAGQSALRGGSGTIDVTVASKHASYIVALKLKVIETVESSTVV